MGEPGTKELLSLEELEAAGGLRTGRKHVLSILVENKPGVLTRIAGLFARRGFNIVSLAVSPTEDERFSRMTIVVDADSAPLEQITKQLNKLIPVLKIAELHPDEAVPKVTALQQEQGRDALDGVASRHVRVLVDVQLRHPDTPRIGAGERVDHWRECSARTAPGRPAVEQDGHRRPQHVRLERGVGHDGRFGRLGVEGRVAASAAGTKMALA